MPKLIIIHYHLNPGGVTRIIESQVQALKQINTPYQLQVVTGYCNNPDFFSKLGVELTIEPNLNYLNPGANHQQILNQLTSFFKTLVDRKDIIHFHNLNLGKNPLATLIISGMAKEGYTVINHAHDFAEDRSVNYQFLKDVISPFCGDKVETILYPTSSKLTYAVLNNFDLRRIQSYTKANTQTYLLPNPVAVEIKYDADTTTEKRRKICNQLKLSPDKKIITYPVRVIRRKNIGEYVLLCHLLQDKANWLVTLPPKNPVEIEPYEQWKQFCADEQIPLHFEVGTKVKFAELIQSSDLCFTTSIKEGFGMVYMEPWLMGTPVAGRNLDYITTDLEQSGMKFPLLYNKIETTNKKDFGSLGMKEQMDFIRLIKNDSQVLKEFLDKHLFVNNLLNSIGQSIIEHNQNTISKEYSLETYARRLERIYQTAIG